MVVAERVARGDQLVVGRGRERTVEQTERLQPGLHLVHGRDASAAPHGVVRGVSTLVPSGGAFVALESCVAPGGS